MSPNVLGEREMIDRELLEAAAKAMGEKVPPRFFDDGTACLLSGQHWNPLTDDGDALRLAVKLRMRIDTAGANNGIGACALTGAWAYEYEYEDTDVAAAIRRAIVRAAAAMAGRGELVLPEHNRKDRP